MRRSFPLTALLAAALLSGCARYPRQVDGPFYIDEVADSGEVYLFRCPGGPEKGCAVDGLPGPRIVAAGADRRYVVVAQASGAEAGGLSYFYFSRVRDERFGWGRDPERIIGPLTPAEFADATRRPHLPAPTIRP